MFFGNGKRRYHMKSEYDLMFYKWKTYWGTNEGTNEKHTERWMNGKIHLFVVHHITHTQINPNYWMCVCVHTCTHTH